MSDSDDTDVLLLIPPNFFLIASDDDFDEDDDSVITELERGTDRIIVGNLITHMNNLENRVNNIESLTTNYCTSLNELGNYVPYQDYTVDKKSKNDIEQYLDNTTTMDQHKIIDTLFQNGSPTKRLALPEVDKLLEEMEISQNEIENKLRMREIEHGIIDRDKQFVDNISSNIYNLGENLGSIPDRGFGIKELYKSSQNSPIKGIIEEPCTKRDSYLVGSSNNEDFRKSLTSLSSRSPMKDFTSPSKMMNAQDVRRKTFLSPRRRLDLNGKATTTLAAGIKTNQQITEDQLKVDYGAGGDIHGPRFKPDGGSVNQPTRSISQRGNLMSLSDLWRNDNDLNNIDDPAKLKLKLEEEKYRRLHLENTVQILQRRVLEEQEKVAVAIKVDEAKDRAIGQITEAWKQMVQHWRQIEADRHTIAQTLIKEKVEINKQKEDIERRITQWEKEKSQALDLAASFKAKHEALENEMMTLKETSTQKIKELDELVVEKEAAIKELKEERKSLAERLQVSKSDYEEEKRIVETSKRDISMLQEQLSKCEAELIVVKEQRDLLTTRIKEEKHRSAMLDGQKQALMEALDNVNEKLAKTEEELKTMTATLDKSKNELRTVYQLQLETVVRDKVAEFQEQLDRAQTLMHLELENSKRQAEEIAQRQQQALVNSHVTEMRRLESMHKDELRTIELKLAESERRRLRLENGKKDIAQKLHGVMESQWRQALNIITSELSAKQMNG